MFDPKLAGSTHLKFLCVQKLDTLVFLAQQVLHCQNSMQYEGEKKAEGLSANSPFVNSNPTLSLVNTMEVSTSLKYSMGIHKSKT